MEYRNREDVVLGAVVCLLATSEGSRVGLRNDPWVLGTVLELLATMMVRIMVVCICYIFI